MCQNSYARICFHNFFQALSHFRIATISVRIRKILLFFCLFVLSVCLPVCPSVCPNETIRLPLNCHFQWIFMKFRISFLVNDQRDAQFFSVYLFIFLTLHVSSTSCSSSGETYCVNTTSGSCHSVSCACRKLNFRPAHDTTTDTE